MSRAAAMLLLGTLALAPAAAGAGETFACKDAEGTWVLGNVGAGPLRGPGEADHACASPAPGLARPPGRRPPAPR